MTTSRAIQLLREQMEKEEADRKLAEAKAKEEQLKKEEEETRKKTDELSRRAAREQLKNEAILALQEGDAARSLDLVKSIFQPPPRTEKDAQTGKEFLVAETAPKLEPIEEARLRYLEGSILHQLDKKKESIEAFEKSVKLDPEFRPARRDHGKMLFIDGQYKKALEAWSRELADGYRDADLLFLVGQARYEVGKEERDFSEWEAARIAFQLVLVERPRDLEVRRWLAILEFETGRYEEALRLFEAIRKEKPLDPEYLELLANCHVKLKDYQKAADYLELAARVKPPTREMCKTLGDLHDALGLYSRAAEWLCRAHGADPADAGKGGALEMGADDKYKIATLLEQGGRLEEAAVWYAAIGEDDKAYARAQSSLAYLLEEQGKFDEALDAYAKVRKVRPQDGHAILSAADIYLRRKKLDEALEAYARAAALDDVDQKADGLAGLAEVAYERGDLAEARRQYQKALEVKPQEGRFLTALKQIEEEQRYRLDAAPEGDSEGVAGASGSG